MLAHEVGHLYNRHSLRIVLQNSAVAVIIAAVTGDLTSITALSATVPTVLMQAKYSRDFEREADAFAFSYLKSVDIDPNVLQQLRPPICPPAPTPPGTASAGGATLRAVDG